MVLPLIHTFLISSIETSLAMIANLLFLSITWVKQSVKLLLYLILSESNWWERYIPNPFSIIKKCRTVKSNSLISSGKFQIRFWKASSFNVIRNARFFNIKPKVHFFPRITSLCSQVIASRCSPEIHFPGSINLYPGKWGLRPSSAEGLAGLQTGPR